MEYLELLHHHAAYFRSRRKIFRASLHGLDGVLQQEGLNEITVELFLCGMYFVFGRGFLGRFDDPHAFLKMQQDMVPKGKVNTITRWWRSYRHIPPDQTVFAKYEERLTRILWNAIRIAKASSIRTNGLPEIMAALCLDEEVIRDLKVRWGFMPSDYLAPRSSFKPPTRPSF